jgi:hypothetical protein
MSLNLHCATISIFIITRQERQSSASPLKIIPIKKRGCVWASFILFVASLRRCKGSVGSGRKLRFSLLCGAQARAVEILPSRLTLGQTFLQSSSSSRLHFVSGRSIGRVSFLSLPNFIIFFRKYMSILNKFSTPFFGKPK